MRGCAVLVFLGLAVTVQAAVNKKQFEAYTNTSTGCPCWWDQTRTTDCACCNYGDNPDKPEAEQCGYPMQKYCQKPNKKGWGCPGIPQFKWTKSGKGYPCYWSEERTGDCAVCAPGGYQCGSTLKTNPDKNKNHCYNGRNKKYCDAVIGDCRHIPHACDPNASCVFDRKFGKNIKMYKCECGEGYTGNGVQCFDAAGNMSPDPNKIVSVEMSLNSDFYAYPEGSEEFPLGEAVDALFREMNSVVSACTGTDCTSTLQ
jgi:hypothetical protein